MKHNFKLLPLVIAATLSLSTSGAMAQATGQASISQTGWHLIDFDPNDGITPAIQFSRVLNRTSTEIEDADGPFSVNTAQATVPPL